MVPADAEQVARLSRKGPYHFGKHWEYPRSSLSLKFLIPKCLCISAPWWAESFSELRTKAVAQQRLDDLVWQNTDEVAASTSRRKEYVARKQSARTCS